MTIRYNLTIFMALLLCLSLSACAVPVKRDEGRLSRDAIANQIEKDDLETRNAFTFAEDAFNRGRLKMHISSFLIS